MTTETKGWERFDPIRCDLCTKFATWRHSWGRHGYEVGHDRIEQHVVAQVWSVGKLRVILGGNG